MKEKKPAFGSKYPFFTQYQRYMMRESYYANKLLFNYVRSIDLIKIYNIFLNIIDFVEKSYYVSQSLSSDLTIMFKRWFKIHGLRYAVFFSTFFLIFGFKIWFLTFFLILIAYHIYEGIGMVSADYLRTNANIFLVKILLLNCFIHYFLTLFN